MSKTAIVTGITGQDGSYLAELLLEKDYRVVGLKRRTSLINTDRIDHIYDNKNFHLEYFDLNDVGSMYRLINKYKPSEFYNLAAQSHVKVSFDIPENTVDGVALGPLRILNAIKELDPSIRFYQASSSEMFGDNPEVPQNEDTDLQPASPYACAKVFAHNIIRNYRHSYGIYASSGILFNHESPRRGETFVTRKITLAAARIKAGLQDKLLLGNLDAQRDWGYAKDYVEAMWLMLQQDKPDDYVIATGKMYSVRDFVEACAPYFDMNIMWMGEGLDEVGIDKKTGNVIIKVDPKYFRPAEVEQLLGDATKAKKELGWEPKTSFEQLVKEMCTDGI